ncbi:MAG TPA: hypothetical protein VK206_04510 [Anaerolineales bacterium]|nr:hypothetical protein [Anaerolineales bacterium]
MKKLLLVSLSAMLFLSAFFISSVSSANADESKVLQFNTMVGVPKPYTGATNAIRSVPGGGLPWVIDFASGKLSPDGDVNVLVKGLVLDPNDPDVIARGIGGTNPIANFKVLVSCLSKDSAGNPITVNVSTGLFPADAEGNAHIQDTVALPQPCIAPIIFVTSPATPTNTTGSWFAATGF